MWSLGQIPDILRYLIEIEDTVRKRYCSLRWGLTIKIKRLCGSGLKLKEGKEEKKIGKMYNGPVLVMYAIPM